MGREKELEALSSICPGTRILGEANTNYIYLPTLQFTTGTKERTMDALLCPSQHGGYTTRLFLAEIIHERGQNWTTHVIVGRTWHTWSWNNVPENLMYPQILSAHLKALR